MAQTINNPVAIIGPQFCAPNPIDVALIRKVFTRSDNILEATDISGSLMFKVKGSYYAYRHVLLDPAGNPVVTFKRKAVSAHDKWKVFRGDSTDEKDLIFSVKRPSMFQWKTKLDIFLANNTEQKSCDYKIEGSWSERSCVVYAGNSSTIVAQMHKTKTSFLGPEKFMVTINPNMDYAFIISVIVILDVINVSAALAAGAGAGSGAGVAAAVSC